MAIVLKDNALPANGHSTSGYCLGMGTGVYFLQASLGFPLLPADDVLETLLALASQTFDPILYGSRAKDFYVLEFMHQVLDCWLVEVFSQPNRWGACLVAKEIVANVMVIYRHESERDGLQQK